jgi:hypothetical protein
MKRAGHPPALFRIRVMLYAVKLFLNKKCTYWGKEGSLNKDQRLLGQKKQPL